MICFFLPFFGCLSPFFFVQLIPRSAHENNQCESQTSRFFKQTSCFFTFVQGKVLNTSKNANLTVYIEMIKTLLSCSWHQSTNLVFPNFFHNFFVSFGPLKILFSFSTGHIIEKIGEKQNWWFGCLMSRTRYKQHLKLVTLKFVFRCLYELNKIWVFS